MTLAKCGRYLSGIVFFSGLVACGSSTETTKSDSATTYTLSGTYSPAALASGTRFAQLSFTDGSDKFKATKANCRASCDIAGTFVMDANAKRLTLRYDGVVESLAFVPDAKSAATIRAKASSPTLSAVRPSALRSQGVEIDLSIHPQCGTVLPKPGSQKAGAPGDKASAGDESASDGSLLVGGTTALLTEVTQLLLSSFDVEDGGSEEGTSALSVRPLGESASGGTTRMNVTSGPEASCGANGEVKWPKTAACRDPLRDAGQCSNGAWAKSGKVTCNSRKFVGEGTEGESCSSLCAQYKDSAGCGGVATTDLGGVADASTRVAKIASAPGMRCGSLVTGCYCCGAENFNTNSRIDVSLPDDE